MRRTLGGLILILLITGCGGDGIKFAPVTGKVTMNGKPLPNAGLSFQPIGTQDNPNPGRGSYAITDKNGYYSLRSDGGREGAVVGPHIVRISTYFAEDGKNLDSERGSRDDVPPPKGLKETIPMRYNGASELKFEVKPGSNQKDWDLTSP